jgi:hypothetical protein
MLLALYGWKPYTDDGDDRDAFISQMVGPFISFPNHFHFHYHPHENAKQTITLTLLVGLLSLSAADEQPQDWAFGLSLNFSSIFDTFFLFPIKTETSCVTILIALLRMAPHFFHDSSAVSSIRNDLASWVSTYPGHFLRRGHRAITWAAKVHVQECHGSSWLCSERHRGMRWYWEHPS